MKTIVHIIVGLEKGGAEMMLRRLVETNMHASTGFRHLVVSLTDVGFHGAALREQGAKVHALGLQGPVGLLMGVYRLAALLRRLKPSIVQTWMVHSDLLGGLAARLVGVPHVIWWVRTTDYSVESRSTRAVRWLCARLASTVLSKIVCAAQVSLLGSVQAVYDTCKHKW